MDDSVRPWISGFVDSVGEDVAESLLQYVAPLQATKNSIKIQQIGLRLTAFKTSVYLFLYELSSSIGSSDLLHRSTKKWLIPPIDR
jgi:hypothetical protein